MHHLSVSVPSRIQYLLVAEKVRAHCAKTGAKMIPITPFGSLWGDLHVMLYDSQFITVVFPEEQTAGYTPFDDDDEGPSTPRDHVHHFVSTLPAENTVDENAELIYQFIKRHNYVVTCTLPKQNHEQEAT